MGEVYGRLKIINSDTHELLTTKGRRKAKEQFLSATKWAVDNGAKVVLLAASTKRLFGRDAKELKEKFPNTIFTIGDNGTAHLLTEDTFNAIEKNGISKEGGNAYSSDISYVLGALSYKKLSLSKGVVFGCFAEAMAITFMINKDKYVDRNWFEVNSSNIKSVQNMFDELSMAVPAPQCFGEKIN